MSGLKFKITKKTSYLMDAVFILSILFVSFAIYDYIGNYQKLYLIPIYIGFSFFLFSNIFKLSNKQESLWYTPTIVIFLYSIFCYSLENLWILIFYISVPIQISLITYHIYSDTYNGIFLKKIKILKDKFPKFKKILIIFSIYFYLYLILVFNFEQSNIRFLWIQGCIILSILVIFLNNPFTIKKILQVLIILIVYMLIISSYLFEFEEILHIKILLLFLTLSIYFTYKKILKTFIVLISLLFFMIVTVAPISVVQKFKKSHMQGRIGIAKQLIDAEISFKSSHGYFYKNGDIKQTLKVLGIEYFSNMPFKLNIKVGDSTILIRANDINSTDYLYMFYPKDNSDKIKGYNPNNWESSIYTKDYINHSKTDIDLQNDGEIVSTYKNEIIKQKKSNFCFLNKD